MITVAASRLSIMRQPVRTFVTRSCRAVDITSTEVGGEGGKTCDNHLHGTSPRARGCSQSHAHARAFSSRMALASEALLPARDVRSLNPRRMDSRPPTARPP